MTRNFNFPILQLDGTSVKNEKGEDLTGTMAVTAALLANFPDEQNLGGEDRLKRFILAQRVHEAGALDTDVTVENLELIKRLVGKAYQTLVVGRVYVALENDVRAVPVPTEAKA